MDTIPRLSRGRRPQPGHLAAVKVADVTAWEPDVLPGYWQQTLTLGLDPDGEGELVATLVRAGDRTAAVGHAVLLVHGFTDYFFHTEVADYFIERGFAFYALDLHKCGRSWREGQTPHFTTDLARYDVELERALDIVVAATGGAKVLLYGHSAGGLIVSLWLDRLRRRGGTAAKHVNGLVLNSPWLDLQGPAILRTVGTAAIGAVSRFRKKLVARSPTEGGYGTSLHRDYHGEFDYDLKWKPVGGFPVTFGWIHAIRRGHARLHRGLDVGVPNLILRSDHSVREVPDPEADPARRRRPGRQADRAVGGLHRQSDHGGAHRRRQTRRLPVVGRAARGRVPRIGQLAGLVCRMVAVGRRHNTIRARMTRMEHFDIAIIGTGSGNSILDERYTDKRVAICEQGTFGGTCLNVGCIPTKMFVYAAEVAQTVRDAGRFGVDATLDGVRWSDIVSRVFGRIDPIAMGGENYRRSSPNVTVYDTHTRFAGRRPTAATRCAPKRGEEFTARPGGDRGGLARFGARRHQRRAASTTTPATPSCGSVNCHPISSSSAADSSPPSSPTPSRRWARACRSSSAAARC